MISVEKGRGPEPSPPRVSQRSAIGLSPSPPCHAKSEIGSPPFPP